MRLANIMKEIHLLPDNLLRMPSVGIVNNLYITSFEEIIHFEKADVNDTTLDTYESLLESLRLFLIHRYIRMCYINNHILISQILSGSS